MWKKTLFAGIYFCSLQFGLAQNATIEGIVRDDRTQDPLVSVNVVISEFLGTVSDLDGKFRVSVPAGEYNIAFHYLGYETYTVKVTVSANETTSLPVNLTQAIIAGKIVVVTAGKFEQDLGELTVSMEVIKPNIIENKSTISMSDVMQQTPGVIIVDNEPQIRSGSGYGFGAGSRVTVLMDDLPILSGDAGRPTWSFLPVENVEQVEVIKGASSVLYGSSALSGVVNVRTSYPGSKPQTKLTIFSGLYSDPGTTEAKYWKKTPLFHNITFLHSRKIGNLDFVAGGNFLSDQGHLGPLEGAEETHDPFEINRANAQKRGRVSLNLRYQNPEALGLIYGVSASWQKGELITTLIWDSIGTGLYRPYEGAATRTKQTLANVDPFIMYVTPKGTRLSLKGRYFKQDNQNDNNQSNLSEVFYGEFQVQQDFNSLGINDFTATAGFVGVSTSGEADLYAGNLEGSGSNEATNYGGYLQLDKTFFNRLTASAGIRYEYFKINKADESKPVLRAGLNYRIGKATYLRGSFGEGYRFPTIAEKFIRTTVGSVSIYPNTMLQSETGWNAEAGIKQGYQINNFRGFLDIAYFRQEYKDYIEFTFGQWGSSQDPLFGLGFKSVNTGKSRVSGVDVSLIGEGKIGKAHLQALCGYTYTKPVSLTPDYEYEKDISYLTTSSDTSDYILKYRMQHLVRADVEVTLNKWIAGASFRYNSFMKNIDNIFLLLDDDPENNQSLGLLPTGISQWRRRNNKGDYVFDMRLGYHITKQQKLLLAINNVLNREYSIRPLLIEKPRTISLQYTLRF
jgi:iron complex outermembrane receptor protein